MKTAPVSQRERIVTIDVIRGFALIGIFLVNMPTFHSPVLFERNPDYSGVDYWLDILLQMFVQTKFYTIFSFLFGLGFYIFMSRAEEKGLKVNRLFSRRLSILLLFGTVHLVFLWFGDILHSYALAGFFLLLFYKRKAKTILIWAFSLLGVFYLLNCIQFAVPAPMLEEMMQQMEQKNAGKLDEYVDMYESGAYLEWVGYRVETEILPNLFQEIFIIMDVLAMFLFGLYAGKIGIFQSYTTHQTKIKRVWLTALILSIPLAAMVAVLKMNVVDTGVYQQSTVYLFTGLSGVALCFFYITSLILLMQKKTGQKLLRPLGFMGQMALTNYLLQTLISVFIFLGLNFYGKVSLTEGTLLVLVILICQMIFSKVWMKHFRFGPMEWLWRTWTYGYRQPMKRTEKISSTNHHSV
ncbi:DUF418 domain-containing protein [Bacillus benzoevorans]|uniref:DUF418 domain-containing protein n=1 Tax=Bacillus benzoevorans TaxID=1456 RepID=A0A7X0LWK7_9BACI|nr:DUF418 domain-containing protein [Bacillus benzoevorans]MBB6446818.1 uncharacterized protein [Bacillus benzoevorans]